MKPQKKLPGDKQKSKSGQKSKSSARAPLSLDSRNTGDIGSSPEKTTRRPKELLKLLGVKKGDSPDSPLLWLIEEECIGPDKWNRIQQWNREFPHKSTDSRSKTTVDDAVAVERESPRDLGDALALLGTCHRLPTIETDLEPDVWDSAVSRLLEVARAHETTDNETTNSRSPIVKQLMLVEIPLTIAFQIPGIENQQQMIEQSCGLLSTSLEEILDHDGWPAASSLPDFGPLVASWVRCFTIAIKLDGPLDFETLSKSEWIVRQVLRLARPDRSLAFSSLGSGKITRSFLKTLLKLSSDPIDKRLTKMFSSDPDSWAAIRKIEYPSVLSQWSESALLQSTWELRSPSVAFDFSNAGCSMEISRDITLVQGDALPEISLNGVALKPTESFEVVCERSDEDLDYVELEMRLDGDARLNRQILLSRTDEFLLVADLVIPPQASRIDYRCCWPLAGQVEAMAESETREIYLRSPDIQSLVLPLALPEWKREPTDNRFESSTEGLQLIQSYDGRGLYAPLLWDLNPGRSRCKRTWRQLTVGESRKIVDLDVGSAFRFQLDKQQWVFYRAISSTGNRTFMGENLICEFVFDRLEKNGTLTQLIEIK